MGYNYSALKLGLYILEDGITKDGEGIMRKRNWTSYYQGDPLDNFVHHDVLKKAQLGLLG